MKEYTTAQLIAEIEKRKEEEQQNKFHQKPDIEGLEYIKSDNIDLNTYRRLYSVYIDDGCEGLHYLMHLPDDYDEDMAEKITLHYLLTNGEKIGIHPSDNYIESIEAKEVTWGKAFYLKIIG